MTIVPVNDTGCTHLPLADYLSYGPGVNSFRTWRLSVDRDDKIGEFQRNRVALGDCRDLIPQLPDESIDIVVTSPPYWGQRTSGGNGVENDPREFVSSLAGIFLDLLPKLKPSGILWINLADSYNTPINWRSEDHTYSSLGPDGNGLDP